MYLPNGSIRHIPFQKLARSIVSLDQYDQVPILICVEYDV